METVVGKMIGQPESANESGMPAAACAPDPEQEPKAAPSSDWGAPLFVWGTWALMLLAALVFVGEYGWCIPRGDEWWVLRHLIGGPPPSITYLWEPHSEHRIPLSKLFLWGVWKLTGCDCRAGMVFNVTILGALTFALIRAAKGLRGWTSYSDAIFPLALLHWGHWENLLNSFQVQFVSSTALAGCFLILIVRRGNRLTLGPALLAGLCLFLLPLCGANGLVLVPALALWLAYLGVRCWRSPGASDKRNGLVMLALAAASLLLVSLWFIGWKGPDHESPKLWRLSDLWSTVLRSMQVLTVSLGYEPLSWWPFAGVGMLSLFLLSAAVLLWVWRVQPRERPRALGFLLFLGAMGCLALTVGWGRPIQGVAERYILLMVPAVCGCYFSGGIPGASSAGRFVQLCLFVLTCVLFLPNLQAGLSNGTARSQPLEPVWRDLLAGKPLSEIVDRYASVLHLSDAGDDAARENITEGLRVLKQAGVWPYRLMENDPPFREVPLPVTPIAMNQMSWQDGRGQGQGEDSFVEFAVRPPLRLGAEPPLTYTPPEPRHLYGLRLTFAYNNAAGPAAFQLSWGTGDHIGGEGQSFSCELEAGSGEHVKTIRLHGAIDRFRIRPDNKPCLFRLVEVVLLVPLSDPGPVAQPVLRTPYDRATAKEPLTVERWQGQPVLRAHADSAVEFDLPARSQRQRISGRFGILPGAHADAANHTDGVQFAVEYLPAGGTPQMLFEKYLDPYGRAADRGLQRLETWLPAGGEGKLVLRAFNLPGRNEHLDWACWTDVAIEGLQAIRDRQRYPMMRTPPVGVWAKEAVTAETCEGQAVLRVHAPSAVEFRVPRRRQQHRIIGQFGILPGAYEKEESHTDGVQFAVDYTPWGGSPQVLFEKYLDPYTNPADRGMQSFAVWLPAGGPGTVVLRAWNLPGKSEHFDWSYWSGVEIEGVTSEDQEPDDEEALPGGGAASGYAGLVRRVREAVGKVVPAAATVLVVSDGDDNLLKLGLQRVGWHFPRDAEGNHDGNASDSAEAIARLEQLRSQGAGYLLLPEPSFWWLDYYKEFTQHLQRHAQCIHKDTDCIIYRLAEPKPD